jgi:hypothetical protein
MKELSVCRVRDSLVFQKHADIREDISHEELEVILEKEFPEQPPGPGSDDFILEPPLGDIINPTARDIVKNERIKPSEYTTAGAGRLSEVYPALKNESQDIEQALHEGFDNVNRKRHVPIPNRFFPSLADLARASERIMRTDTTDRTFYIVVLIMASLQTLAQINSLNSYMEEINTEASIKTAYIKQLDLTDRFFKSEPRRPGAEKFD